MTIILPTGLGFLLGQIFIPRESKATKVDLKEVNLITDPTVDDEAVIDSSAAAA